MSIYTHKEARTALDEALKARSAVLNSQEYKIANRTQRRALLAEVNADLTKWEKELESIYASNPELNPNKLKTRKGPTITTLGYRYES